jgi:peptidoglycan-associated lipoprotein
MHSRIWRVAVFSLLIFAMGCVGCAKRPTATTPAAPAPTRVVDVGKIPEASAQPGVPGVVSTRPSLRDFRTVVELKDIHFEFDRTDISPEAARVLDANADWLRTYPQYPVLIEGHTDERGTSEYNLTLGERRARATLNYLASHGVAASRFVLISYGEEKGVCRDRAERCWSRNRRAHFGVARD